MTRLSDLIKGGQSPLNEDPDKKNKKTGEENERISFKDFYKDRKKDEKALPKREERKEENTDKIYRDAYGFVEEIFTSAKENKPFIIDRGYPILSQMIKSIKQSDALFFKTVYKEGVPENYISHAVNVCIYSIRLGLGLEYDDDELRKLGMSAFLHNIGMTKIPEKIVSKREHFTSEDERVIQKHSQYGYDIIINTLGEKYRWLADIVYQIHEREGGQGYPQGLKGEEIHEYAKVIGISDVYEALTHNRPHRKRILPYNAVREIIQTYKGYFAPEITKILITELSVFPLNSYVKLNSNEIGVVVETSRVQPLKPVVKILFDSKKKKLLKEKIVDLAKTPFLYITDSIHEEDL